MMTRDRLKKIAAQNPELCIAYAKQHSNVTKEYRKAIGDHYKVLGPVHTRADPYGSVLFWI